MGVPIPQNQHEEASKVTVTKIRLPLHCLSVVRVFLFYILSPYLQQCYNEILISDIRNTLKKYNQNRG